MRTAFAAVALTAFSAAQAAAQNHQGYIIGPAGPSGVVLQGGQPHQAYYPPHNPVIHQGGSVSGHFDPWTNHTTINQGTQTTFHSATDPNRHVVDPGSMQYVNRMVLRNGQWVRETGRRWTSYGVPHADLNYGSTTYIPNGSGGTTLNQDHGVAYSHQGSGGIVVHPNSGLSHGPPQTFSPGGGTTLNQNHTVIRSRPRP
ncbi:hypothetical protein [Alienimonas sp. DA493]|uniref:hypothetical protein n=1 Tax=Alienimonas sp. DA493 TaxID=3373605 RepID=UPI00375459F8